MLENSKLKFCSGKYIQIKKGNFHCLFQSHIHFDFVSDHSGTSEYNVNGAMEFIIDLSKLTLNLSVFRSKAFSVCTIILNFQHSKNNLSYHF